MSDISIKGIASVAELEMLVGKDIGHLIIDLQLPTFKGYKGDDYYRKRAYSVEGQFANGGKWYAGVMIHKGKLLGIKYPNRIKWQEEWNE